jgi:hypothetical protein
MLQVFKTCGQPRLGKRSLPPSLQGPEAASFASSFMRDGPDARANRGGGGGNDMDPVTAAGTSIRRIVKDVREKVCSKFDHLCSLLIFPRFFKSCFFFFNDKNTTFLSSPVVQ